MEAMKKIIETERQASSIVTEARVYKTMLLNQARKKADEQANKLLLEAENIRKQNEQEALATVNKIDLDLAKDLSLLEQRINSEVIDKKKRLVDDLILEVKMK